MGAEMKLEYSRREMLRMAGMAAGAAVLPAMVFGEDLKKRIPIGLELYSVRNELAKDFTGIITQVGKMGYEGVEFAGYYGWDKKPNDLRKLLDENGLKCCGTHTALNTLEGENMKMTADLHKWRGDKLLI